MVKVGAAEQDLHLKSEDNGVANAANPSGFDPMEEEQHQHHHGVVWVDDREQDSLLDVNEASIFYDDFPPLPDFPCMSSSSSSSSTQPVSKPIAGTSSSSSATSAASWAAVAEEVKMEASSTAVAAPDCMDVMENFGYMDLIDCNDLWDPSSVFQSENPQEMLEDQQAAAVTAAPAGEEEKDGLSFLQGNSELAMIFFEWLKQNKDYISAEDMRSIKLKRSTIESASKRLGSTKEGKKQLLKLILEWVEQYQLQKKARLPLPVPEPQSPFAFDDTLQIPADPNFMFNADPNPTTQHWMQDPTPPPPPPPSFAPPMMPAYSGDPYMNHGVVNGIPYGEYPPSWAFPQFTPFPDNGSATIINRQQQQQQSLYANPYQMYDPNGERLAMRLGSSATKEARKKRMARQRRLYSHHHRHSTNSNQHQNQLNDPPDADQGASPGDWVYWSPAGASSPTLQAPADANSADRATMQPQNCQRQAAAGGGGASDRRQQQGWKTEKNLKFLLQKVLKQSDVGNLGRIVLPKKEAESHLPELETRDGISIAMEDIGTSRIWNMRYRFWPNNKSRMYLLENTGDFVRVNGLQEGDFIVIYSDTKCGKYMIRGVKVRQAGGKLEGKKPARRNIRNISSLAGNSSSLAPIRQAVR
ncbi:B3 domain-containing transcription factor ABI3 [Salvia miltiorrhiza]|uniref:B3 domain-containing transcription factor ABI3 n=1 Tax=Salvia miltiorrhiza TaxID=226208 RepID=UPI0025AC743B|nr:B3 domain-containing transcription factor ABI3 [Salvia miltiorrhiza]